MVLFMKGPRCDEEIERASKAVSLRIMNWTGDIPYQIPTHHTAVGWCFFDGSIDPIQSSVVQTMNVSRYRVKIIESESNAIFKNLKKLLGGRGVKKQGKTLVCGPRLVAEVIKRSPERCLAWISSRQPPSAPNGRPVQSGMDSTGTGTCFRSWTLSEQKASHRSFRLSRP
jgi:hypothetical protein